MAYLAISDHAVSPVLLVERDKQYFLVYYVSCILPRAKQRYLLIEKFAYALLIASRKLRLYFKSHHIVVLTNQPLKNTLERYGSFKRLFKWVVELALYVIRCEPRRATKAQALADFIALCSIRDKP